MKQFGFDPMESIIKYIKRYGAVDNFFFKCYVHNYSGDKSILSSGGQERIFRIGTYYVR